VGVYFSTDKRPDWNEMWKRINFISLIEVSMVFLLVTLTFGLDPSGALTLGNCKKIGPKANLTACNFNNANLRGVNLSNANLFGA
jgi:hypothetical protein